MANKKTHNGWKAFGAILLAIVLFAGGAVTGWFAKQEKWFEKAPAPTEDQDGKNEKSKTLRFEAEDGELSGGCKAVDDSQNEDGRTYVGDFTNSATVTFELDASAETPVTMLVRITSPKEDTPLKELMTINVNGEPFESDVTAKGAGEAKWTTWQTLLAGRLVLKEGANAIVFGGAFDGVNFDFFKILFPASVTVTVHQENGGLAVDKSAQGSGISLVSTHIPVALYEEYGISPAAENAQTITATVSPDNDATNTGVTWSAAWEDPSSEWATGKEVQEYLTLTPAGEGYKESKTVTVQCLQAFGEKIVITCKSVDNPAVQATVKAHYVQKLEDFTLKFGDVVCDFDSGETGVSVEVNKTAETAPGGPANLEIKKSETAYTIALETTETVTLSAPYDYFLGRLRSKIQQIPPEFSKENSSSWYDSLWYAFGKYNDSNNENKGAMFAPRDTSKIESFNVLQEELKFSIPFFAENFDFYYHSQYASLYTTYSINDGDGVNYFTPNTIIDLFNNAQIGYVDDGRGGKDLYGGTNLFDLTVKITGINVDITKKTTFKMTGYTNLSAISSVTPSTDDLYY